MIEQFGTGENKHSSVLFILKLQPPQPLCFYGSSGLSNGAFIAVRDRGFVFGLGGIHSEPWFNRLVTLFLYVHVPKVVDFCLIFLKMCCSSSTCDNSHHWLLVCGPATLAYSALYWEAVPWSTVDLLTLWSKVFGQPNIRPIFDCCTYAITASAPLAPRFWNLAAEICFNSATRAWVRSNMDVGR